jgi:hypothetical protein
MPACTGLPPGELMRITTATAFFSSNALRSADTMFSALASPSDAISPRISTSAVCGPLGVEALPRCADTAPQITARASRNHARRPARRQRRSVRRSRISSPLTCATKCSRRERSAPTVTVTGGTGAGAGAGTGAGPFSGNGGVCVGSKSCVMGGYLEKWRRTRLGERPRKDTNRPGRRVRRRRRPSGAGPRTGPRCSARWWARRPRRASNTR